MTLDSVRLGPFWRGPWAMAVRGDAIGLALACYLMTGPEANPYGLVRLVVPVASRDLGLRDAEVTDRLSRLADRDLLQYDPVSATAWICDFAAWQLGSLKPADHRVVAANRWYLEEAPDSPFLEPFYERYHGALHLRARRTYHATAVVSPTPARTPSPSPAPRPDVVPGPMPTPAPQADSFELAPPVPAPVKQAEQRREVERWFHERFWPAYPRKVAKRAALVAVLKLKPDPETRRDIEAALARQRATVWSDPDAPIPHAATWIHGERWLDEVPQPAPVISRKTQRIARAVEAFARGQAHDPTR